MGQSADEIAILSTARNVQMDDFWSWGRASFDCQQSDRDRQFETPWAAGAGIEISDSPVPLDERLVRMAVEHHGKFSGSRVKVQSTQVVQHVNIMAFEKKNLSFRESAAWAGVIDISAHRSDGRNFQKGFEDGGIAHVAKMQNLIDAGERGSNFWSEQPVSIADDADFHRLKLKRRPQRLLDFAGSGLMIGSTICMSVPGSFGPSMAMQ
jgi:hypothetical protein